MQGLDQDWIMIQINSILCFVRKGGGPPDIRVGVLYLVPNLRGGVTKFVFDIVSGEKYPLALLWTKSSKKSQ